HHIDAAPRHRAHEALALELRHRLTYRRTADAEVLCQAALVEADLGTLPIDIKRDDNVLERRIGAALEACRTGDWLDRDRRTLPRPRFGGGTATERLARTHGTASRLEIGIQNTSHQPMCPISFERSRHWRATRRTSGILSFRSEPQRLPG